MLFRSKVLWAAQCAPEEISGAFAPSSSNLTRAPQPDISTGRGLRKPRASNSAGAACNGAQVVVFERQRPRFGKGDCNSRLTTPFPSLAKPGLGDEGTLAKGEQRNALETLVGAQNDTVRDARTGAVRED